MKSITVLYLLIVLFALQSCSNNSNPTSSTNPYHGNWNIAFDGSYVGGGTISIGNDGSWSSNVVLKDPDGNQFTNTITGSVSNSGAVSNGKIFYNGSQIGTISGSFSGNGGSGTWQTDLGTSGTWTASK